jgi:general secretion pathway protein D
MAVDVSAALAQALSAENQGQLDAALAQYERILRVQPGNDGAARGIARIRAERRNRADRLIRRAQQLFLEEVDYDAAIRDLNAALAADPGNEQAAQLLKKVELAKAADARRRPPLD